MVANIIYLKFRLGVSDMNVTDVRVRKLLAEGKMKAIVSVTLDTVSYTHLFCALGPSAVSAHKKKLSRFPS